MRTLYIDCANGVSGDMTLSALIDLGVDEQSLLAQLNTLPCAAEFSLRFERVSRYGFSGVSLTVHESPAPGSEHRVGYRKMVDVVEQSRLSPAVKARAQDMFLGLAKAEAAAHGCSIEQVHFHEVGAIDTIVDVCGVCCALEMLEVERCVASPVNLGGGKVSFSHGTMSVPVPAVVHLLQGHAVYGDLPERGELTTPTGATIIRTICRAQGSFPAMTLLANGAGFGQRYTGVPNILRMYLGEEKVETAGTGKGREDVCEISCNIDDMTGESLGFAMEHLLYQQGVLDVYYTPVMMKKSRPAALLTVLCTPESRQEAVQCIFRHTKTLGMRYTVKARAILDRQIQTVNTPYGSIRVKISSGDGAVTRKPEFEDCAQAAREHQIPLEQIYQAVLQALEG